MSRQPPDMGQEPLPRVAKARAGRDDWLNLSDYMVRLVRLHRDDMAPVRSLAAGIVEPFERDPDAFVRWYRDATAQGRRLRCVFEDTAAYRRLVGSLQLRNLDEGILGDAYEEDSVLLEPGASHFGLVEPDRLRRHLDALIERVHQAAPE